MTNKQDYFDADMGLIWVQPDGPNTEPKALLCHSTDGVEEPQGDVTSRLCRTPGGWQLTSRGQGTPGEATMTIEAFLPKTRSWLQKQAEKRCPIPVYLHMSQCGSRSAVFLDYDYGELAKNAYITSKSKTGMVRGFADAGDGAADPSKITFELSAEPGSPEYWPLVITRRTAAEAEPFRDIAFCNSQSCSSACGSALDLCTNGVAVPDATGPGSKADVWFTTNTGATWAAAATQPFAAAEDISSVVCFPLDKDTTRVLVACGTAAAAGLRVAYSDNSGTTWTVVAINAVAIDHFDHGGSLFALDRYHIWACSSAGIIYFSSDAGATWTNQGAPVPGGGAEPLMCVRFVDENYGMCVGGTAGASGVLLTTTDGGDHWVLGTSPAAQLATGVTVIDANKAWITFANGTLYYTNNYGTAWTARTLPTTPTKLGDVQFIDEFCGASCGYITSGGSLYPTMYRTFNGGYDWEEYRYTTALAGAAAYYGLNSVWVCDYNHVYSVGEPDAATGFIFDYAP